MSIANKYHVFRFHEFLATLVLAAAACWAVYPENRLKEQVLSEKNSPVAVKYLESIVRLYPENGTYRMLLADRYIGGRRYERAMAQLLDIRDENPDIVFSGDVRRLALYREAPQYFRDKTEHEKTLARTLAVIRLETSRTRLGTMYAETSSLGIWPGALAAAQKILPFETWNRYFWLMKAAAAAEYSQEPALAAGYYLQAALAAPDLERRRQVFRKAFLVLSSAGLQTELKHQLALNSRAFSGDRHTAATLLSFARQTGDAYFARDIALGILRSTQ